MLFGGTFVFVTFACLLCYKLGMAESQQRGERDIDIENRRELKLMQLLIIRLFLKESLP